MPSPSHAITRAFLLFVFSLPLQADITITQLANEGAIISDGETRVMIDGLVVEPYSVYGGLPQDAVPQFRQQSGAFRDVDVVLSSHRHHDHHQPRFACEFLQGKRGLPFYSGSQVIGLTREKCREFVTSSPQVHEISPGYDQHVTITVGGASISVFPLSHGTRKYARIQNFGHLVEIGGMKVLHVGDAAMDPAEFERAGIAEESVDVALIPFWYFNPGPGMDILENLVKARHTIAVHIPPGEMAEVKEHINRSYPQVLILENPLDQAEFSSN